MDENSKKLKGLESFLNDLDIRVKYAYVNTDKLVFKPEYRTLCEKNDCGNYNQNYSCPPLCGTPREMEVKARRFDYVLVLQTEWKVKDCFDKNETEPPRQVHNAMSYKVIDYLKKCGINCDAMLSGPCDLCKDGCLIKSGRPCVKDYHVFSCASAYCLDVASIAAEAGMRCWEDKDRMYLFTMILF